MPREQLNPFTWNTWNQDAVESIRLSEVDLEGAWTRLAEAMPHRNVFVVDDPQEEIDDDDFIEVPAEVPSALWRPRRGQLATVRVPEHLRSRVSSLHDGEVVMIDDCYGDGILCNDSVTCVYCNHVDVLTVRPSGVASDNRWTHNYSRVSQHQLEPLRPEPGQEVTVRCDSGSSNGHYGNHIYTDGCRNPIRTVNIDSGDIVASLTPLNESIFADRLAELDIQRAEREARIATIERGQEYRVDAAGHSIHGLFARILGPRSHGEFPVQLTYPDGSLYRHTMSISPFYLGARVYPWTRQNLAPGFIQFGTPTYATAAALITDREVIDSPDDHECDHACFEYGCTQGPSAGWDGDDYSDDEEPEDYVDDIPIMPYSYQPQLTFSGEGPVYLGMELELSCGRDDDASHKMRNAVRTLLGSPMRDLVYLKSDASIEGRGFEAVFHPMSYDWAAENWPVDLLRRMRADGAMPHSSCGMHVHVSRSGFSDPVHAFKWIKFMYRNGANISRMARRDPSQWGTFRSTVERKAAKWHAKGGYGGEARYVAINCIPRNTYEVRIFASTLNRTRLLGSLGLVDASVEYTRQLTTQQILQHDGWSFDPFREFVHSFKKYKPLQDEMARLLNR